MISYTNKNLSTLTVAKSNNSFNIFFESEGNASLNSKIFDSPDLISSSGKDYANCNYLSISGATLIGKSIADSTIPVALETFLNEHDINKIYLHFDNDRAGKETALKIQFHLEGKYEIIEQTPYAGKDFNELCMIRNGNFKSRQKKKMNHRSKHLHSMNTI